VKSHSFRKKSADWPFFATPEANAAADSNAINGLEILFRILYYILMRDTLERINLNVPVDVRRRLREMAAQTGRTEAEVARSLLIGALDRAHREELYRRVGEAYTSRLRARDLKILRAFERLDG
jgi:hypothetical protein